MKVKFQLGTHDPGPWSQHPWTKFSKCSLECRIHQTHFIKHFSLQFIEEIWIFVILLGIFDDNDDDDDDDYADDDLFFGNGWLTKDVKRFLQPEWLLQGSQHRKPATHHEKDFPLSRTWVYVLLNEVVSSDNRHTNFSNKKAASKYFLFHLEK